MTHSSTAILAFLLPLLSASAQTARVIPADRATTEGFSTHQYPFSYSEVRFQQILLGSQVATTVAVIDGASFRRDGSNTSNFAGHVWNYLVTLYETPIAPVAMTTTWASNRGPVGTVVLNGALNVPAANPAFPTPNPFSLRIPFNAPFIYTAANGHLLLEIEGADAQNLLDSWSADAETIWTTVRGDVVTVASGCLGTGGESFTLGGSATSAALGATLSVATRTTGTLLGSVGWIGASSTAYGGFPLPLDLTPMGANGCNLGTGILALQALTGTSFLWPIPSDPALENAVVFTQGLGLAPSANPAGFVTSNTQQIRIGGPTPRTPVFQSVFRRSGLAMTTGSMGTGSYLGAIVQLDGVFN